MPPAFKVPTVSHKDAARIGALTTAGAVLGGHEGAYEVGKVALASQPKTSVTVGTKSQGRVNR